MKKAFFNTMVISIFVCAILSCSGKNKVTEIQPIIINFENCKMVDISDSLRVKIVPLEINSEALLSQIEILDFLNDKVYILSHNKVVVFDKNGKFLTVIGTMGAGPGEYKNLSGFYIKNETIFLVDEGFQKVFAYDENGKYLYSTSILQETGKISVVYPIEDGLFIAKNGYFGNNTQIPSICVLNEQYKKIRDIENRYLSDGTIMPDNFYPFQDHILYWEFFNDTIFSIVNQKELTPKYIVDFQEYAIPAEVKQSGNVLDILHYYISSPQDSKLSSLIKYIHEDASYIRFVFMQKEQIVNYVKYDKKLQQARLYRIIDSCNKLSPTLFMQYRDETIIIAANIIDSEDNPVLVFINEKDYVE
jgi:hypothetical protein